MDNEIRLVPHARLKASDSLAIDHVLMESMAEGIKSGENPSPIIRTYQFSDPAVILGWNQKISGAVDVDECLRQNIGITRRDTAGGHMLYHPEDFHFSFIAPSHYSPNEGMDVIKKYQEVNQIVFDALREIGVDSKLVKTSVKVDYGGGEYLIAGTAQRHVEGVMIHQGGIFVRKYSDGDLRLLKASDLEKEDWNRKIISLEEITENDVYQLLKSFIGSVGKNHDVRELDLKDDLIRKSRDLAKETYGSLEFIKEGG